MKFLQNTIMYGKRIVIQYLIKNIKFSNVFLKYVIQHIKIAIVCILL